VPLVTTTPDNFDALLTTTTQARQRILVDNIHDSTPTLMFYNMRGRKRMQDGGESILTPLLYAKSDSFQDFTGYQTIDVDPQEGITGAQWTWKESAVTVTISRRERRQNSGEHAVVSLLDAKMQQAELAAADGLNTRMLGTNAANTLRIFGFQNFFSAAAVGSQTGTVGGINKATYTWWNNPQSGFENYERVVQPFERLQSSTQTEAGAKIGELGFQHLMFKGAFMFFDDACLANQMYMINTRYTDLVVDTQSDWSIQPFVTPNNQAATSALILWMGALTFSNLSRQGLVANVDTF
jgi:hypothetical protein